jgi:hypothetical protein
MKSKFDSASASQPYVVHDESKTPVGQPASPCGTGLPEPGGNPPSGLARLGAMNGRARFRATDNAASPQSPVAATATPSAAQQAPFPALSRPQIDAILNEVLSLVEAHQKKMPPADSNNDKPPACSTSDAAPQQRSASAHNTASPAHDPQAATPDERPLMQDTGQRPDQLMSPGSNRIQRRLSLVLDEQKSQGSGSPRVPDPDQPPTPRTDATLSSFDPDELRQATLASIESEKLRKEKLERIDSANLREAMQASIESENLRRPMLGSSDSENLHRASMASKRRIAKRDRPAALATADLAKAYFGRYPGGVGGIVRVKWRHKVFARVRRIFGRSGTAKDAARAPSSDSAWTDRAYREMAPCNERFRTWLKKNNMRAVPTSGAGNNCLIVSLLRHATGDYDADHRAQAAELRTALIARFPALGKDEMLMPGTPEVDFLLERLERSHPPLMHIAEVRPDRDGIPQMLRADGIPFFSREELEGRRIAPIFQQGAHYEPIVARF